MKTFGVYVGRFNPIHRGHEMIIREMVETCGIDNSLVIIGSSNNPFSLRHFFTYEERRKFIKSVFPDIRLVGLPDYHSNRIWLKALDDILALSGIDPSSTIYFGGCEEDVRFFLDDGRKCRIIERYEGRCQNYSATRVRDCLIHNREADLKELLSSNARELIRDCFVGKWEEFKKI